MLARMRARLSYANVMSSLAVFLGLGGAGAYAANTVFSTDIVDGEVKTADLANSAVVRDKIANSSVVANKINGSAVTAGKIAGGAVDGSKVADNSMKGADIDEGTLDAGVFTKGSSNAAANCIPTTGSFSDCVGTTFSLPRAGPVLIYAGGVVSRLGSAGVDAAEHVTCRLEVDDATTAIPHSTATEAGHNVGGQPGARWWGFGVTAVTSTLPAGPHTFELSCVDAGVDPPDSFLPSATLSAVLIGG